jgi:thioredoxin 1
VRLVREGAAVGVKNLSSEDGAEKVRRDMNKDNERPRSKGDDSMSKPIELTSATFDEEVLHSEVPVLVDFWAAWCGPCRLVAPVMNQIAEEYEGSVKVAKVNVDAERELAASFGISSIPTIALFEPDQQPRAVVGALSKEGLEETFGLGRFSGEAA